MELVVECDCGWTTRGEQGRVVEATQVHMRQIHDVEITREQVLAKATPALVDRVDHPGNAR